MGKVKDKVIEVMELLEAYDQPGREEYELFSIVSAISGMSMEDVEYIYTGHMGRWTPDTEYEAQYQYAAGYHD